METVIIPKELTAENGAKYLLTGDFKEEIEIDCPVCYDPHNTISDCEVCEGTGTYTQKVTIEWDTIKRIYKKAVTHLATPSMPLERAKEITSLCSQHALYNLDVIEKQPASISKYSLAELLEANKIVSEDNGTKNADGTTSTQIHCDPRFTAALYTAYHFPGEPQDSEIFSSVAQGPGNVVLVINTKL